MAGHGFSPSGKGVPLYSLYRVAGEICSQQLSGEHNSQLDQLALLPRIPHPRLALTLALTGALSFWLPDVAMHILARQNFDAWHARIITLLMPATLLIAYVIARRFAAKRDFKWVGAAMLSGVWLTGGLFMAISATAGGGGFAGPDGVRGGLFMTLLGLIPLFTFMEATYDGGGLALLAVTLGALLLYWIQRSGMPLRFHQRLR